MLSRCIQTFPTFRNLIKYFSNVKWNTAFPIFEFYDFQLLQRKLELNGKKYSNFRDFKNTFFYLVYNNISKFLILYLYLLGIFFTNFKLR